MSGCHDAGVVNLVVTVMHIGHWHVVCACQIKVVLILGSVQGVATVNAFCKAFFLNMTQELGHAI